MSGEKKHWRLPTPFRRLPGKQDLGSKAKVGRSESGASTVYLSDNTSTSGFIVVPEFDDLQPQTAHEQPRHASQSSKQPAPSYTLSLGSVDIDDHDPRCSPYLGGGPSDAETSPDDELSQRLGSAYEHIRSMPSAASHKVPLSSDPQMLRKQLGVPQHSVLNYPIHTPPDLPNPHTAPREVLPHRMSPAASPDMTRTRIPRKPGVRIDTNIYPNFRDSPLDAPRPPQKKSVINAPILTENSSLQCSMRGVSRSAHIVCAPKPQPSTSNLSKPSRLSAEGSTVSPSCFLSSRQKTSGNILQETVVDTLPSTNAHRQQTSIQIRSPSPFTVDMPLHHTWHDRRTDFQSTPESYSKTTQSNETKSRRTSESTEALASIAWIGASPMPSSSYTPSQRNHLAFLPDRFGMAIAVEDDSISDDILVDRLEKVRQRSGPSDRGTDILAPTIPDKAHFSSIGEDGNWRTDCLPSSPSTDRLGDIRRPSPLVPTSEDTEVWQAARKTLLCIREIIRTEKKYQEALKMLLNAETTTPPPRSMVPYISALVRTSEMFLKGLLEDPSAWGVSTAFVTSEDELEAEMVSWCAVAGAFFMDGNDPQSSGLMGKWRLRKAGIMSSPSPSVTKQMPISPRLPPTFPTMSVAKEQVDEENGAWQYPQPEQKRQMAHVSPQKAENTGSQAATGLPPGRKLSVRDLAIQPIQRVMRYVLLYRDLLDCTPSTSPSRLLVERALEAATRIANQCDKAQRNPAFFHAS